MQPYSQLERREDLRAAVACAVSPPVVLGVVNDIDIVCFFMGKRRNEFGEIKIAGVNTASPVVLIN